MNRPSSVYFLSRNCGQELSNASRQVPFPGSSFRQTIQSSLLWELTSRLFGSYLWLDLNNRTVKTTSNFHLVPNPRTWGTIHPHPCICRQTCAQCLTFCSWVRSDFSKCKSERKFAPVFVSKYVAENKGDIPLCNGIITSGHPRSGPVSTPPHSPFIDINIAITETDQNQ
jgi:hypothetical protein